ncbi:DUF2335 domain-containing protein [Ancylobacter oerskovii]|nr:DUF2335 domain-containing protein [Ancylobacter oerskovii]
MREYRDFGTDWPERIMAQWETESAHRRSYETWALRATIARDLLGQIFAGAFALSALYVATIAFREGYPAVAATIVGGTIISVVGAFLYQRNKKP